MSQEQAYREVIQGEGLTMRSNRILEISRELNLAADAALGGPA